MRVNSDYRMKEREEKGGKKPTQFYSLRGETELDRVRGGRGGGREGVEGDDSCEVHKHRGE